MEDKLGVFICTGYGIADALDVDALVELATDDCEADFCTTVETCEGPGLAEINQIIAKEELTRVVVAGVSPRRMEVGAYPDTVVVEQFALREHVVWCQPANHEDTQMLAEDYLRMYVSKVRKVENPLPFMAEEPIDKTVLVVGGGVTGLTAALNAVEAGYDVQLVEKSDTLGGWLGKQYKSIPTSTPFRDLESTGIDELVEQVRDHKRITVRTSAVTAGITGGPGLFDVRLESADGGGGALAEFRVGSIIQATGWNPVEPRDDLPWGRTDDVVRNVEVEEMMKTTGKITRPSDGGEVKSIAFIQCGGKTGAERHSYCSSICCMTSLKQALYLRELGADTKAYIFYEFMRTPGHYEDFFRRAQDDEGIFPTRGQVVDVQRNGDGKNVVTVKDTMVGEEITVEVDLVVLAAGMEPNSADGEAIRALEDAKRVAEHGDSEALREDAAKKVEELSMHEGTNILNLDYRQGPDLPNLEHGFPDSHFICFPYESRRTGIYPAGAVRTPMDGRSSREDGIGAALKAIQCVEMTSRGEAVHPRAGDKSYPDFALQRCTQCKRCTEECPFGVLNEDEKGNPQLRATRCRRCGVCMGACPERIVSFKDYSVDMVATMIKAIEVPDEDEEKPRFLALLCENDALPAFELMAERGLTVNPWVRIIPVRCLGSVNVVWVKEALSAGYDGITLIGCRYGDDYQCHFIKGSELANKRGENVRETLEKMAMENERVELHQLQIEEFDRLPELLDHMCEVVEEFGMNPFKGM